jgi:methionyl-tRNA formyltransferase
MTLKKIDLYLGGQIGLWALRQVPPQHISRVFTLDTGIVEAARSLEIEAWDYDVNTTESIQGEIGFSVHYPRILRPHLIERYRKIYNLHPGYLPWGRGFYPVFWALWEQTPAGATLHEITAEVDEGPIVAQIQVKYYSHDTGGSLHERVREAEEKLFLDYWPRILKGESLAAIPQLTHKGSYHTKKEFFMLKEHAPLESLGGEELLRLIRCLTFPGFSGLVVLAGEKKFDVRFEQLATLSVY